MAEAVLGSKCKPHPRLSLESSIQGLLALRCYHQCHIFVGPSSGELPGLSPRLLWRKDASGKSLSVQTRQVLCSHLLHWSDFRIEETEIQWKERSCYRSQFSSVAQLCPPLCNPMDWSTPGFPVQHQLPELVQTHIHWVGDAIQPSHPLSSPSPPAFNLSQHQGLFQWVSSSHQVAKVLELQHQFFQWKFWVDIL